MDKTKATIFYFKDYSFDEASLTAHFNYSFEFENREPLHFTETVTLPKASSLSKEALDRFLEPIHLMLGISYYKLYCPSKIIVPYDLSPEQAHFWDTVYRKGLGEFLYRNNLNPSSVAKFPVGQQSGSPITLKKTDKILLGVGGGKDSIVAAELLRDYEVSSFLVETQKTDPIGERVAQQIGNPLLIIKRTLDEKLFQNHEGSYNGHIPVSGIFAFLGLLTAGLYGYGYVVVGNEYSSNFGNLEYQGEVINHQWSKSAEFEQMLQAYTRKFITPDITYFSALRQFYEFRIVKMFVKHKKYFPIFSSCNRNFKVHKDRSNSLWCGECPKCVFMFLLLAAHLSREEVLNIFHKNLFTDEALLPLFKDVLGLGNMKPFDCVGTFEESRAALYLASKKFDHDVVVLSLLPFLKSPEEDLLKVLKTSSAKTLPTAFRFLGIDNVCLLGYGTEGRITHTYLKKYYPHLDVGILDVAQDANYLEKQTEYDLAIKTPGISRGKVRIPYTTATNMFFSKVNNMTIGVTGSKGKSTTATLIYEILKTAGKKVRLLGNIGTPMLGALLEPVDPEEIFVIELSSYMLEDIEYSPSIAVLLNLFPEHMDYHGDVETYYQAKKNIFKYQHKGDHVVTAPFHETLPVSDHNIPLRGTHNKENIKAAVKVARLLNIPDSAIEEAILAFKPLPHRLELVGIYNEIVFYDDAISTTPESTIMAIKSIDNIDTIFLGGQDRGYDFTQLQKVIRESGIKNIVLFPDSGTRMLTSFEGLNVFSTSSMKDAVDFAFRNTKKGAACLLSCASPSYSLWKDFNQKGDEFQKYVKEY